MGIWGIGGGRFEAVAVALAFLDSPLGPQEGKRLLHKASKHDTAMSEIHFGDVVQLKAATTSNQAELKTLGFIEQGKNNQVMLVMPPCKDGLAFKQAEFIM